MPRSKEIGVIERGAQTNLSTPAPSVEPAAGGRAADDAATTPADGTASLPTGTLNVPWNLYIPTVDIHLVGYGLRLPNDFTLEMLAVLQRCKRVFGLPPIHAPEFKIPQMESLLGLYGPQKKRLQTYREMVDLVLDAAVSDPPVAFAGYGSAVVGVLASHLIIEEAPKRNLTVHVTNAVSSFDGIWADFNIEPFFGFEVWEATFFLRAAIEPDPRTNLLLPQAPVLDVEFGHDLEKKDLAMETSSTVHRLRDHLLRFYAPDHQVHYIWTGAGDGPQAFGLHVETLPLRDLDHPGSLQGSTLLVPRAIQPKPGKYDFASRAGGAAPPGG